MGPGRPFQVALGDQATLVATIVAGDNYFSEELEAAKAAVRATHGVGDSEGPERLLRLGTPGLSGLLIRRPDRGWTCHAS